MWHKYTTSFVDELIISGIDELHSSCRERVAKVHCFSGKTANDIHDYIKSLMKKAHENIILHICIYRTKNPIKSYFR